MRMIAVRYFNLQLKRAVKNIPFIVLYLVAMSALAFVLFKGCVSVLATEGLIGKINIGIVLPQDDETAEFAVSLVASMDSVSSMCEFHYMDEATGTEALKQQEIYALVLIPESLLQDIISGENTPVKIVSLDQQGVEAELFHEFAQMGIEMLGYAQMGVYAVDAYCAQDELLKPLAAEMNLAINELYIRYTFSRLALFKEKEISATDDFSFGMYYFCAAIVMLSLFAGIPMVFYFEQHSDAFLQVCRTRGILAGKRMMLTFGAMALTWSMLVSVLWLLPTVMLPINDMPFEISGKMWLAVVLMGISVIAYIQFIYKLMHTKVWGILFLFFSTIGMMFVSGGFIPTAILPKELKTAAFYLPTTYWIRLFGDGLTGDGNTMSVIQVMGIMILFLFATCGLEKYREYKGDRNTEME